VTWPLPDRPKLAPKPTREERERERRARLEAMEADPDGGLPRGVTRREDGSFHVALWRRDDIWIVGGMVFAYVLLAGFLVYWTTGAPAETGTAPADGVATFGKQAPSGPVSTWWWVVGIVIVVAMVAIAAYVVWVLFTTFRGRGVRFDDVSADEQARRREVARLLNQVEPPVSREDAERQLGHVSPPGPPPGDP
jgi:hypothetical protein